MTRPEKFRELLTWAIALAALAAWLGQCAIPPHAYTEFMAHNSHSEVDLSAWLGLSGQMQDYAILAGVLLAFSMLVLSYGLAQDGRPRGVWVSVAVGSLIALVGIPWLASDNVAFGFGGAAALTAPFLAIPALVWAMRQPVKSHIARVAVVIALLSLMTWGFPTCQAGATFNPPSGCGAFLGGVCP